MNIGDTKRSRFDLRDGTWQWSVSTKLTGDPRPASGTYRTSELVVLTSVPVGPDVPFEDAADASISFLAPADRPEPGERSHFGGCGKSHGDGRKWFSMSTRHFSDGSSESRSTHYDTIVGTDATG